MLAEAKAVLAENVEKPAAKFRLSTALSAHLETPDRHETFKIGDVVRAAPPDGGGMKFEGEKSTERTGNDRRGMNEGQGCCLRDSCTNERRQTHQRRANALIAAKRSVCDRRPTDRPTLFVTRYCQRFVQSGLPQTAQEKSRAFHPFVHTCVWAATCASEGMTREE